MIFVDVDSRILGVPYFNFLGGTSHKKTPCIKICIGIKINFKIDIKTNININYKISIKIKIKIEFKIFIQINIASIGEGDADS